MALAIIYRDGQELARFPDTDKDPPAIDYRQGDYLYMRYSPTDYLWGVPKKYNWWAVNKHEVPKVYLLLNLLE